MGSLGRMELTSGGDHGGQGGQGGQGLTVTITRW